MLVTCEKCSSRYQLADDKLKTTGTKVRCPRCQHTFRVFAASAEPAAPVPKPIPPPPPHTENYERNAEGLPRPRQPLKPEIPKEKEREREPSPFKRPSSVLPPTEEDSDVVDEVFAPAPLKDRESPFSKPEAEEDTGTARFKDRVEPSYEENRVSANQPKPFGDATFFALQNMAKVKRPSRRWVAISTAVLLAAAAYFVLTQGPSSRSPELVQKKIEPTQPAHPMVAMDRPANWYGEDSNVFQDFLNQTAARPPADQKKPEVRSLVAEALILNGLLNGADDQTAIGLGIASSLIAAYPTEIYGLYGLATYAQWRDDPTTLGDLIQKWPPNRHSDPEYRVSEMIVEKSKNLKHAVELAKAYLAELPTHRRTQILIYSVYLDAPEDLQKSFGESTVHAMQKIYQKVRSSYGANAALPQILKSIDKKMARRTQTAAVSQTPEPQKTAEPAKPTEVEKKEKKGSVAAQENSGDATQRLNERALQRLEEKRRQLLADSQKYEPTPAAPAEKNLEPGVSEGAQTTAAPSPTKAPTKEAKKVDPKKLPRASNDLVATNKEIKREKSEAQKVFDEGVSLQKANRVDEAINMYQKTLRLNPDFADVYRNLGVIYMNRRDNERALRNFKIYLQLKPDGADKQMVEGWISSLQ